MTMPSFGRQESHRPKSAYLSVWCFFLSVYFRYLLSFIFAFILNIGIVNYLFQYFKCRYSFGLALMPLLLMIAITSSSVMPFELTVRILSELSVSTFLWQTPSALSKSDLTFDSQPPQLRFVLY